jgi:uroporphyrinogen decarboxylase
MTQRERFYAALQFQEPDRPPHFEQMFELTEEAFGLKEVTEDEYKAVATNAQRERLFARSAELYARIAEEFKWDAVLTWRPAARNDAQYEFIPYLKKYLGPDIPVGSFIWESSISIDTVKDYTGFAVQLYERPEEIHAWARQMLDRAVEHAKRLIDAGCSIIDIASDYAFNAGTFISPAQFREFVTPYVVELVGLIQRNGVRVILHSDGNLMRVMDQILEIGPDVLQSIDPQAGMDIAEVKRLTYGKMALMGNVECRYVQDGPDEKILESAGYCLDHAAPGGGFIYSTSNTVFPGVPLRNYRLMLEYMWNRFAGR